jgi:hypothetical protein
MPNMVELLALEELLVLLLFLAEAHFMVALEAVAAELILLAYVVALEGGQAVMGVKAARMWLAVEERAEVLVVQLAQTERSHQI